MYFSGSGGTNFDSSAKISSAILIPSGFNSKRSPPILDFGFSILDYRIEATELQSEISLSCPRPLNPKSKSGPADANPKLFNDLIRPHQHVGRNRQADLLSRLQVDDQLEFLRLFDGNIGWLGPF